MRLSCSHDIMQSMAWWATWQWFEACMPTLGRVRLFLAGGLMSQGSKVCIIVCACPSSTSLLP